MSEKYIAVFMAPGCEEIEALTVVDILFRAGIPHKMVSITDECQITSSHEVTVKTACTVADVDFDDVQMIVLPGGIPGTPNLHACAPLIEAVHAFCESGRQVSAICAAPSILAKEGLLEGRRATSNPNFQHVLAECGADLVADEPVVVDANLITSQGMGTAIDFALEIVRTQKGDDEVERLKGAVVYWGRA